jgi:hypothetical protein
MKIPMSTQPEPNLKDEIFINIFVATVIFTTLWVQEKVYEPLTQSDFGKVASLTCVREKNAQVNCESDQLNRFSRSLSTKEFQLIDVSLEEYSIPESGSGYSLILITNIASIDITHGDYAKDKLNYSQLKKLLTENKEASVSLRYRGGFARWFVICLFANLMLWGYFIGFFGILSFLLLPVRLLNKALNR